MNRKQTESKILNLDDCLDSILTNYHSYIADKDVVYKSCRNEWIAMMQKLDDTITNESRKTVIDINHAKFRANKLLVLKIFNKFDCNLTCDEIGSDYDKTFSYRVGEVACVPDFNSMVEDICTTGIHYYKTIETAFYHNIELANVDLMNHRFCGTYRSWLKEGQIHVIQVMKDGIGEFKSWHEDGGIAQEGQYKNCKMHGLFKTWYRNGQLSRVENFVDDKLNGDVKLWYLNGKPKSQCEYLNNEKHGTEILFSEGGNEIRAEFRYGIEIRAKNLMRKLYP